jgi:hypothetical protein
MTGGVAPLSRLVLLSWLAFGAEAGRTHQVHEFMSNGYGMVSESVPAHLSTSLM